MGETFLKRGLQGISANWTYWDYYLISVSFGCVCFLEAETAYCSCDKLAVSELHLPL